MLSSDSEMEGASMEVVPIPGPYSESPPSFSLSLSPSLRSLTSARGSVGCPRRSHVWDYLPMMLAPVKVCARSVLFPGMQFVAIASRVNSQQI